MSILIKEKFKTVFDNTDKLKKSNLGIKGFLPKSGNRCHFGAVLDPGNIKYVL